MTDKKRVLDIKELTKIIDDIINEVYKKACNLELINKLTNNENINIFIIKNLCAVQIMPLNSVHIKILRDNDELFVQYYDDDIADDKFKIEKEVSNLKVKLNKKIKLFQ